MKRVLMAATLAITCLLGIPVLHADEQKKPDYGHDSVEKLVDAIKTAASKKDLDLYLQCSCWERLPEHLKARFKKTTPLFMKDELLEVKASPSKTNPLEGTDFEYNVEYEGNLEMTYKEFGKITVGYGKYKGRYYLATPVKKTK